MYRAIAMGSITPLIDEADTVWGTQKSERNEDLRGLVNGGHRRGSFVLRVNNRKGGEVEKFETFAPVVLAGIGDLPDTIVDRSVVITMRRRLHNEKVEPFRMRKAEAETEPLKEKIEQWVNAHGVTLSEIETVLPDGIEDRAADVWEPLVIIGDQAGEKWSQRLRLAAKVLNAQRVDADESLGIKLLKDCQSVFENSERLTTSVLLKRLTSLEESQWSDLYGKCLSALGLSKMLSQFDIKPDTHRFGEKSLRGYLRENFMDAWDRYLEPPIPPIDPQHPQQVQQGGLLPPSTAIPEDSKPSECNDDTQNNLHTEDPFSGQLFPQTPPSAHRDKA